jgi:hypothetical protein
MRTTSRAEHGLAPARAAGGAVLARPLAAIRAWRTKVPRVAYTLHEVSSASTGHDAAVEIAGDFPGSPVTLTFHFQFAANGRITALTISP